MDGFNLDGMQAAHPFEAHGARRLTPAQQSFGVSDVAVNRIDGLHSGSVCGIYHSLARVKRFRSLGRPSHAEIGGVVFQSDSDTGDTVRRGRDGEGILDTECRLQDWHQPDRSRNAYPFSASINSS